MPPLRARLLREEQREPGQAATGASHPGLDRSPVQARPWSYVRLAPVPRFETDLMLGAGSDGWLKVRVDPISRPRVSRSWGVRPGQDDWPMGYNFRLDAGHRGLPVLDVDDVQQVHDDFADQPAGTNHRPPLLGLLLLDR